jgi:hypothetical protein
MIFMDGARALAHWLDLGNLEDAKAVLLTGLLDAYYSERRRLQRPAAVEKPPDFERPPKRGWTSKRPSNQDGDDEGQTEDQAPGGGLLEKPRRRKRK